MMMMKYYKQLLFIILAKLIEMRWSLEKIMTTVVGMRYIVANKINFTTKKKNDKISERTVNS